METFTYKNLQFELLQITVKNNELWYNKQSKMAIIVRDGDVQEELDNVSKHFARRYFNENYNN